MNDPRHIDWELLLTRLTARALKWFRDRGCLDQEAVLPGTATSAIELAYKAVLDFENGGKKKWHPETAEDDPFRLIAHNMWNDFKDLVKKSEYKRYVSLDESCDDDGRNGLESVPASIDVSVDTEAASLGQSLNRILDSKCVSGKQLMKDYIYAVCEMKLRDRDEIASLLGVTPREITDVQRRLDDERIHHLLKAEQQAELSKRRRNVKI